VHAIAFDTVRKECGREMVPFVLPLLRSLVTNSSGDQEAPMQIDPAGGGSSRFLAVWKATNGRPALWVSGELDLATAPLLEEALEGGRAAVHRESWPGLVA
jgi:hypothetical protein